MNKLEIIGCLYLLVISIYGFLLFALDKERAIKGQYRLSEKFLLGVAYLGGGIGCLLGMKVFNHKTRVWRFRILVPLSLLIPFLFLCGILLDWNLKKF